MFLLDTDVVSALRDRGRSPRLAAWCASTPSSQQYTSAFTIAELELTIGREAKTDLMGAAKHLDWLEQKVLPAFAGRILSFDQRAARLVGSWPDAGHVPYQDAMIAAVAVANRMTLVTRATWRYEPLGIPLLNPWL